MVELWWNYSGILRDRTLKIKLILESIEESYIEEWKREDIEKRTQILTEVLIKIWPYFGDSNDDITSDKTAVTGTTPKELLDFLKIF